MNLPILSGRFGSALSVLACAPVFAQTVEFDTRCIQGGNFTGAELGDIDGDGDLDVVAYDVSGGNVVWLENNLASTGNWAAGATVGSLASTTQIQIVDANGDGHLDIMAFSASGQQLEYYRSLGTAPPTFAAAVVLASTSAPTSLVSAGGFVAADFDGQGDDVDIVIADNAQTLLLQDLGSSLSEISGYPGVALGMQKVAAGDFDGNDGLDVVLSASYSGGSLIGIMNTGSGVATFGNAFRIKGGFPGANHLAVGNFDGLNHDDVILCSTGQVSYFGNDGTGVETFTRGVYTGLSGEPRVRAGQLDGANGPDLVIIQDAGASTSVEYSLNNGTTYPFAPAGVWSVDSVPNFTADGGEDCLAIGNVGGDSLADIVTLNAGRSSELYWLENVYGVTPPESFFTSREVSSGDFTGGELGDLDGDGDLDAVAYDVSASEVVWVENGLNSTGGWGSSVTVGNLASTSQIQLIDVDSDADLDVVAFSAASQQLVYYPNQGGSPLAFGAAVVLASSAAPALLVASEGFVAADFDGDGDHADFVIGDNAQTIYIEDANPASVTEISGYSGVALGMRKVAAGNFDGIGGLDVVLSSTFSGGSLIGIMNTGSGVASFGNAFRIKSGFPGANHLAVGNFDGLNHDDVILCSTGQIQFFGNDGSGVETFTRGTLLGLCGDPIVRSGRLDLLHGDDLVIIQEEGASTKVQYSFNNGSNYPFAPAGIWQVTEDPSFTVSGGHASLAVGDLDRDGFADVLTRDGASLRWLENDSSLPAETVEFESRSLVQSGDFTEAELGDLDGDGDRDVVAYDVSTSGVVWIENDLGGTGSWGTSASVGGLANTSQIQLIDVDSDTDLDVVAFSAASQQLVYYPNEGGSPLSFGAAIVLASSSAPASLVASSGFIAADFDGDGDHADFVIGDNAQTLYIEDANPAVATEISGYPGVALGVRKVAAGNFDGVGGLDVVMSASFSGGSLLAIMNNGTSGVAFGNAFRVKSGFTGANHLIVGDMDGQNHDDVVLCSAYRMDYFGNDGSGIETFTRGSTNTPSGDPRAQLGNLDGQNSKDLVMVQNGGATASVQYTLNNGSNYPFAGGGTWRFAEVPSVTADGGETCLGVADLDGDGIDDILVRDGSAIYWVENKTPMMARARR